MKPQKYYVAVNQTPAPNAYTPRDLSRGPAISMASRHAVAGNQNSIPGPGAYDPQPSRVERNSGAFSFRSRTFVKKTSYNPAPGAYNPQIVKKNTGSCYFAKKVGKTSSNNNPGPGYYDLRSTFGSGARNSSFSFRPATNSLYDTSAKQVPGPGSYCVERRREHPKCTYIGLKLEELGAKPYQGIYNEKPPQKINRYNSDLVVL